MTSDEARRLLTRKTRRGALILRGAYWFFMALGTLLFCLEATRPWGLSAMIFSVGVYLGYIHVSRRYALGCWVAANPQLVFWAHAAGTNLRNAGIVSNEAPDNCRSLKLHLRNGPQLDVEIPREDLQRFTAWLKEQNPTIRWGHYDSLSPALTPWN